MPSHDSSVSLRPSRRDSSRTPTPSHPTRRDFLKSSAGGAALGTFAMNVGVHAAGSDVIKVGVVGCGGRGAGAAVNALNAGSGVEIHALCDLFMDRIKKKRGHIKRHKPEQVDVPDDRCFDGFDGYKKVIACCDVMLVANAAKFHPLHLRAGIEAGKHVFVEKPHAIDPAGVKEVAKACELAKQKNLAVLSGLHSRWHPGYVETMKRIHDGAIGDVVTIEENFLRGPYGVYKRLAGLNEVQWQCSTQYHFTWLSGDDVPQSLIHNVDRSRWALREQTPVKCHGLGGRSSMTDPKYGNVFDHHSVVYEFASGVRLYAFCRTTTGCYNEHSSLVFGTKGRANVTACTIEGETQWKWKDTKQSPYDLEIKALIDSIRAGKPINSGYHMAKSTLATVMGQLSCYTGQEVTWEQAEKSDFYYAPKPEDCSFDMEPPIKPGPDGSYPVYKPGETKLL